MSKDTMRSAWLVEYDLALTSELVRLSTAFDEQGIAWIAYKGPVLSQQLHGDVASRSYCDLDIIVDERQLGMVTVLLNTLGYRRYYDMRPEVREWMQRFLGEEPFVHAESGLPVDVHWWTARRQSHRFVYLIDLLEHRTFVSIGGRRIPTLASEAMLVLLCVHGCKHAWTSDLWLEDVALLVSQSKALNWDQVFRLADKLGAERMVLVGLRVVDDSVGLSLPDAVRARIRSNRTVSAIATRIAARGSNAGTNGLWVTAAYMASMERWSERAWLGLVKYLLPTPVDVQSVRLPRPLFPLYYGVRPLRLFGKHVLGHRAPG